MVVVVGIDIGSQKTMLVRDDAEIILTETGSLLFIFIFHYYLRKGPTKMTDTRPHPWKIALFPSTNGGFCKLGCQLFYVEV